MCGVPGDKLEVKQGFLYINDALAFKPSYQQYKYNFQIKPNKGLRYIENLIEEHDLRATDYKFITFDNYGNGRYTNKPGYQGIITLTDELYETF